MEITEVRIKLMEGSADRLQGFCSITFDNSFVVRDLKIIEGSTGPFVAMPSRKLTSHCPGCGCKNHLRAAYCNQCGLRLKEDRSQRDADGRMKLYADVAHPINSACRELIQSRVIAEYRAEVDRSQQPGYVSRYEDDYFDDDVEAQAWLPGETKAAPVASIGTIPPAPAMPADLNQNMLGPGAAQAPGPISVEPFQPPVPPPHAFSPAPARPVTAPGSPSPAKEADKPAKPKGNFGEGIFEG